MKSLLKKVRGDKKGFTLAELLVVVAIIGILVAISIPVFTAQLTKARLATNQANMRAAKAAAVAAYLSDGEEGEVVYNYDITSGETEKVTGSSPAIAQASSDEKNLDPNADDNPVTGDEKYNKFSVKVAASADGGSAVTLYASYVAD